jgi:osmotically-inducible protein OsmY
LSGTVATPDERRRAVQLARETKGVVSVDDRLTIGGSR